MQTENKMLKIGFPKGNLLGKSLATISSLLDKEVEKGKLSFSDGRNYKAFLLKHRDVPLLLQRGELDYAVASTEWLEERESTLPVFHDLGWSKYRICLIGHHDKPIDLVNGPKSCVTEYPILAERYIRKMKWEQTAITTVSGSSEALVPDLYECCIDCVETGSTLQKNNLVVLDTLLETSVVLVGKDSNVRPDKKIWAAITGEQK